MTTYTSIPNTDIDQDSPVTQPLMTALRDNPIAITEGASGAPRIVAAAIEGGSASSAGDVYVSEGDGTGVWQKALPSSRADVTGSRSIGTIYQNTGATFMVVSITVSVGGEKALLFEVSADGASWLRTIDTSDTDTARQSHEMIVLPGEYYRLATGSSTIDKWIEAT
jgi:hypothetical protein